MHGLRGVPSGLPSETGKERGEKSAGPGIGARTLQEDVRERSSSGGVFSVLADWVLEREGAVFAAGYGPDLRVAHREVDGKEQLDRVRRTKYVQSGMDGVYGAIRDRLAAGRQTLFAGTPCQAEAVRRFLERDGRADRDCLILVDLVCYGAASPRNLGEIRPFPGPQVRRENPGF